MKAKNPNQIKSLRQKAEVSEGVFFTNFVHSMTIGSSEEQLKVTSSKPAEALDYLGICLYETEESLKPLTKRFSLFRPVDNSSELTAASEVILKLQQEADAKDLELLQMKKQIALLESQFVEESSIGEMLSIAEHKSIEEDYNDPILIGEDNTNIGEQ